MSDGPYIAKSRKTVKVIVPPNRDRDIQCLVCGLPMHVPAGTIQYYHRGCRKNAKRIYGKQIQKAL